MSCSDTNKDLSLYGDGTLSRGREEKIAAHLSTCPVCRETAAEFREMRRELGRLSSPQVPHAVVSRLRASAAEASRPGMFSYPTLGLGFRQMRLAPLAAGVMASLVMGLGLMNFLMSGAAMPPESASMPAARPQRDETVMIASNRIGLPLAADSAFISPTDFASQRLAVAAESPSINPQGALMAVTRSLVRGEMKDEEMVVVARVFGNGLARITDVVEPAGGQRAVAELQRAFDSEPNGAPFVPASLDGRGDDVQVVLKFRSVNVRTGLRPRR